MVYIPQILQDFTCRTEYGESSMIELIRSAVSSEISILISMMPLEEELKSTQGEEFLNLKECFNSIILSLIILIKELRVVKMFNKLNKSFSEWSEIRSSIATLEGLPWRKSSQIKLENENLLSILQGIS